MPSGRRGTRIHQGDLLVSSQNDLGPGKAVATGPGSTVILEYFDSPGEDPSDRHRQAVPRVGLRRYTFSTETRVFWHTEPGWRSGRVMYTTLEREVCVRGYEWEGFVPEAEIYIRWHRPLTDPVGFAAGGLLESPLLADRRRPFLQGILSQRAAARGMGSVLSSSIELHEHQIEIARRILDDPIQRYLLADEVGLGKTIEAGLVLRQLLLDHKELEVQLILPPFLIEQWRRELEAKFLVTEFRQATLRFSRDDEPADWRKADIVVVDEAHNLARFSGHPSPELRDRYQALRRVAIGSPRVLLLSATPVLHNESTFLAMFHLLDPDVYNLDDVDSLRAKVAARADLGRVLLGLRSSGPPVLLRRRFDDLAELFPEDDTLRNVLENGRSALEGGDRIRLEAAVTAVRVHVTEVYRLNRRMLRTRRTDALSATYRVTGRRPPELLRRNIGWALDIDSLVDSWRQELLADVEGDEFATDRASSLLASAVRLIVDPPSLAAWARDRGKEQVSEREKTALDRLIRRLDAVDPYLDVAVPLADDLSYAIAEGEWCVVFCATAELGRRLAAALAEFLGSDAIETHLADADPGDAEQAVRSFEDRVAPSRILLCDASAEEGRNLQFADVLVHVGVPSDPNRLEQRIGRFDRWSSEASEWRSLIVDDSDGAATLTSAWRAVLTGGFGVFERSIASLQHVVEVATAEAWRILFVGGAVAARSATERVSYLLEQEIEKIREQDALDAIAAVQDERSLYRALTRVEETSAAFGRASDELFALQGSEGNLRFSREGSPTDGIGGYRVRHPGSASASALPLVPAWRVLRDFVRLEGHQGTFVRDIAVRAQGIHLYRYGDSFIDSVADFLWHDDRGRAWGLWRHIPGWKEPEHPWFRFDYHVEASSEALVEMVTLLEPGAETASITRRLDGFLPPIVVSLWLDANGKEPGDNLQRILEAPYDKWRNATEGRDYNLSRRRIDWVYDLIPLKEWSGTWRLIEKTAASLVESRTGVLEAVATATSQAERLLDVRIRQLQLRLERVQDTERRSLAKEIRLEQAIKDAMIEELRVPEVRLDSVGVVIVSSEIPTNSGDVELG